MHMGPWTNATGEITGPPRESFLKKSWYDLDMAAVLKPMWHIAAHSSELSETGSFITFTLGEDEIFVVRTADGTLRAYHNFCPHRGHRLCTAASGKTGRNVTCAYHGWAFAVENGGCSFATRMHDGFDKSEWGLAPAWVEETDGLVFVSVADRRPPSLVSQIRRVGYQGYDLSRMKLAVRKTYTIAANWKVVVENNSECYHCALNHPELCTSLDPWKRDYDRVAHRTLVDAEEFAYGLYSVTRPGSTFTVDGNPTCDIPISRDDDGPADGYELWWHPGNLVSFGPDHVWIFTLKPLGPELTEKNDYYLVHEDAVEGIDYEAAKLTEFFVATMAQDQALCEEVQRGLRMPRYMPGPLNQIHQSGQIGFYQWYSDQLHAYSAGKGAATVGPEPASA